MAFQAALVGGVYAVTYGLIALISRWLPPDAARILWGFFFFFGLGVALLVRWILTRCRLGHLTDSGIQRRITGWSVDYLIVATATAIQLTIVRAYLLPIGLIALANALATTLLVVYCGRRLTSFSLERTAAIYGVVTGTVSCGLLLLRMVDPEFKTPVACELAVMNVFALPVVGGCTVLVNGPLWWGWSLWTTMGVFAAVMVVAALIMQGLMAGLNKSSSPSGASTFSG